MPYARLEDETRLYYEFLGRDDGPVVLQFGGGLFGRHNFGSVNDGFVELERNSSKRSSHFPQRYS